MVSAAVDTIESTEQLVPSPLGLLTPALAKVSRALRFLPFVSGRIWEGWEGHPAASGNKPAEHCVRLRHPCSTRNGSSPLCVAVEFQHSNLLIFPCGPLRRARLLFGVHAWTAAGIFFSFLQLS